MVNEDLNTWAAIATYEEDFSELTLVTSNLDYCMMTPDADFQGLYVSEYWEDSCPFIGEYGWTYASLTFGSDGEPVSITGPFGNQWYFKDEETFA